MGAHLSKWIKEKSASDQAADCRQCDEAVELRLAALLVELRDRDKRTRKTRTVASVEGAATEPLRATDVVPDQLVEELTLERKEAQEIYVPYLRRAAASKPLVERIDVKIGNQQYNMPRVTLPEAATLEELAAMNAQYISYGMLGKGSRRKLHKRQEAALAAVGGMNQDRFVVDGSGFGALVYVHDAFSDAGLRGKRVLLLLDAEMGIDKGYMKKCFGSATPDGDRVRHDLKSSQKVKEWGAPEGSSLKEFSGSKMHYEHADGRHVRWRMGSWVARTEAQHAKLRELLARYGLEGHWPDVQVYLSEAHAVLQRYGPLLLATGMVPVREADLPEGPLREQWDVLSFLTLDSGGSSRLGVHVDTDQLYPCLCTCDSLYPPGYYDVQGGGLCLPDGVWVEEYSRKSAILLNGHTATHTVLPLSVPDGVSMPMLRATIVHWSHAGKELVQEQEALMSREDELPCMYMEHADEALEPEPEGGPSGPAPCPMAAGGGEGYASKRRELYAVVRELTGAARESRSDGCEHVAVGAKRRTRSDHPEDDLSAYTRLMVDEQFSGGAEAVGELALQLRIRGGGTCTPGSGAARRRRGARRSRRQRNLAAQQGGL